jgi:hypothetical protein
MEAESVGTLAPRPAFLVRLVARALVEDLAIEEERL